MILNLSDVLSEHHKTLDQLVHVDLNVFQCAIGNFPVLSKTEAHIIVSHVKNRELLINGTCDFVFEVPCDRCLEPVKTSICLDFTKNVDLDEDSDVQSEELDEKNFIDGYNLDVDKLLYNEILIGWPMKVLCGDDCKGICNTCGQNLNKGTCDCEDTSLDPRMSVIRDVFKNFKEV